MAENVTTAQVFLDVRLTIPAPAPAYPFGCGSNPLAGVLPCLRLPLPVLSRLGGRARCALSTRLPHLRVLVAQSYDAHGGSSTAVSVGGRRRPSYPQHRGHQDPLEARRAIPKRPESWDRFSAEEREFGRIFEEQGDPWGMPRTEDEIAVARLHVVRRRVGVFEKILGRLAIIGMGTERRDAASWGRRHRFSHGHDAVGAAHGRPLGTTAMLLGPQMGLLGSAEAHDSCLLLRAC